MRRVFGGVVVDEYLKVLKQEHLDKFEYGSEGVIYLEGYQESPSEITRKIHEKIKDNPSIIKVAVPYNNKEHIIGILVDREARVVEYFDPVGHSSSSAESKEGTLF